MDGLCLPAEVRENPLDRCGRLDAGDHTKAAAAAPARHGAAAVAHDIASTPLKTGDTLLLLGPWEAIDELRLRSPNLAVLDPPGAEQGVSAPSRALGAVLSVALMIALMISAVVPNVQAALIACLLNTATAILMAPVAIGMAADMGASPYPSALIVALAASGSYMTPVSSPVNTMVAASGNYRFGDFVRSAGRSP